MDMPAAPLDSLDPEPRIPNPEHIEKCADLDRPEAGTVLLAHASKVHLRWHMRCDFFCHQSTLPVSQCNCLCGGAFHGLGEGTPGFAYALGQHGARLVAKWKGLGIDVSGLENEMAKMESGVRRKQGEKECRST